MRSILSFALCILAGFPARAAAEAPPKGLLPAKEIADGWIQLFDGTTTFGWKIDGDASANDGTLVLGGAKATEAATTTRFGAFRLRFDYQIEDSANFTINISGSHTRPLLVKMPGDQPKSWVQCEWEVDRNSIRTRYTATPTGGSGRGVGSEASNRSGEARTTIGFSVNKDAKVSLRNIKLQPLGLEPIFNGKDLTGWKEFPGKKSKFTVTPEGWINVTNGPGDLQTESQWGDFVLQLECISNGKHLNSGVFFRCRPNEYQNGYEAQIHNGFTAEPSKEYTIEEYDPQTHKLVGKKKVKYTALDYGTGAIYRRMPARCQVAKDNEWFAMTVIAEGRHIAVWVNGYPVTDWTDNRPDSDNARNGYRQAKGPISLQGHDPTTNLSFRNIRIAELPKSSAKER